jgi:hypothetical protein
MGKSLISGLAFFKQEYEEVLLVFYFRCRQPPAFTDLQISSYKNGPLFYGLGKTVKTKLPRKKRRVNKKRVKARMEHQSVNTKIL